MLTLYSILAPRLFVPVALYFDKGLKPTLRRFQRNSPSRTPPSSYIAQVRAIAIPRERLMRFKPGVPYEIMYELIEDDVLFPDHALVVSRMAIIFYDVTNHRLQLTNSF